MNGKFNIPKIGKFRPVAKIFEPILGVKRADGMSIRDAYYASLMDGILDFSHCKYMDTMGKIPINS